MWKQLLKAHACSGGPSILRRATSGVSGQRIRMIEFEGSRVVNRPQDGRGRHQGLRIRFRRPNCLSRSEVGVARAGSDFLEGVRIGSWGSSRPMHSREKASDGKPKSNNRNRNRRQGKSQGHPSNQNPQQIAFFMSLVLLIALPTLHRNHHQHPVSTSSGEGRLALGPLPLLLRHELVLDRLHRRQVPRLPKRVQRQAESDHEEKGGGG